MQSSLNDDESTHTIFSKHVHIKRLVEIEEEDTTHTAFQNNVHIRYLVGNQKKKKSQPYGVVKQF